MVDRLGVNRSWSMDVVRPGRVMTISSGQVASQESPLDRRHLLPTRPVWEDCPVSRDNEQEDVNPDERSSGG